MDFKAFSRLCTGDPVTFHLAMELFLQNGRAAILESRESELVDGLKPKLGGFFTAQRLYDVAKAAKELADLETKTLLDYMGRSGPVPADSGQEQSDEVLTPEQADGRALSVDLGFAVLEASAMLPAPDMPIEVSVELVFPGGDRQDFALVRPLDCRPGCEVLVWNDPADEHYTDSFEIPVRKDLDL